MIPQSCILESGVSFVSYTYTHIDISAHMLARILLFSIHRCAIVYSDSDGYSAVPVRSKTTPNVNQQGGAPTTPYDDAGGSHDG